MRPLSIILVILAVLALLLSIKPHEANRVLHEEEKVSTNKENRQLQSLPPHKNFNPPGRNPSQIPGPPPPLSNKASTISQKGYAGHVMPHPPHPLVYSQLLVGVAKNQY
ncbi:hypothetical protein ACSBR2_021014 [Camellia fascicularis]